MLLLLAWMLWLYRYPDENDHDSAEEEREVEATIHSNHLKESVGENQSGMFSLNKNSAFKLGLDLSKF